MSELDSVMETEKPQVSIIEDNKKYADTLARYLEENGFELVEVASSIDDYKFVPTDLLVLDMILHGKSSIDFIETAIRKAAFMDILILTAHADEDSLFKAMELGAKGYLTKDSALEKIHSALTNLYKGGVVIAPKLAKRFWALFSSQRGLGTTHFPYTEEDRTIIEFIGKGLSKAEVADVLGLPRRTVKTRLQKMYQDLGINNQVSLVVHAVRSGWIEID